MTFETIEYVQTNALVTLRLNRPKEANGLNVQLARELAQAAQKVANDKSVKVVILTGKGRFFSAGGDINDMLSFGDQVAHGLKGIANDLHEAMISFAQMPAPLIVAVNGTAAGAGFSLAVAGDLVLASESAKFTMAYTKIGLSPDGGASFYLPRLIGLRKTQELMFTNRVLSAHEAQEWGLINRVISDDDLEDEALKLAAIFETGSRGSNAAIKNLLLQSWLNDAQTQMELEGETIAANAESKDGREGANAFAEKRKPKFS